MRSENSLLLLVDARINFRIFGRRFGFPLSNPRIQAITHTKQCQLQFRHELFMHHANYASEPDFLNVNGTHRSAQHSKVNRMKIITETWLNSAKIL